MLRLLLLPALLLKKQGDINLRFAGFHSYTWAKISELFTLFTTEFLAADFFDNWTFGQLNLNSTELWITELLNNWTFRQLNFLKAEHLTSDSFEILFYFCQKISWQKIQLSNVHLSKSSVVKKFSYPKFSCLKQIYNRKRKSLWFLSTRRKTISPILCLFCVLCFRSTKTRTQRAAGCCWGWIKDCHNVFICCSWLGSSRVAFKSELNPVLLHATTKWKHAAYHVVDPANMLYYRRLQRVLGVIESVIREGPLLFTNWVDEDALLASSRITTSLLTRKRKQHFLSEACHKSCMMKIYAISALKVGRLSKIFYQAWTSI